MITLLLYSLSLRFFLFEFKTFEGIRQSLKRYKLVKIFLECPFCSGFWCGLFVYILFVYVASVKTLPVKLSLVDLTTLTFFGFSVGFISFLINLFMRKMIKDLY